MDCLCETMAVNVYFILWSFSFLTSHVPRFHAVCQMDLESGFLSLDNFRTAMSSIQRQPKMEYLQGLKVFFDGYTCLAHTVLTSYFLPSFLLLLVCC